MGLNRWLGCIENPLTGHEANRRSLPPPSRRRRVLVVGAGPAGLQTAIAAAGRGHDVTVAERDEQVGGQIRLAASVPNRAELGDLVRNQMAECTHLGVTIELGRTVTADLIAEQRPDAVVVATGSRPARPYWAPPDDGRIVDVVDVLNGTARPQGDVVVIDELGFHQATSTAELLADRGCHVEILTPGMVVGQDLGITLDMENWWFRAEAKGIVQTVDSVVVGLDENGLQVLHHPTGAMAARSFDWVVLAVPAEPNDGLYHELAEICPSLGIELHRVGDSVAPRRAHAAVYDGDRAGRAL